MIYGYIPAKGTPSVRVPGKNLRELGGKPLIAHAIENMLAAQSVDRVFLDSESDVMLDYGVKYGAEPLKRPPGISLDYMTGDDMSFWFCINFPDMEGFVYMPPTCPFIGPERIDEAVSLYRETKVNTVIGMHQKQVFRWECGIPTHLDENGRMDKSQNLPPTVWETTGLYVIDAQFVLRNKVRIDPGNYHLLWLDEIESIDIDTEEDWALCEAVWKGLNCPDLGNWCGV